MKTFKLQLTGTDARRLLHWMDDSAVKEKICKPFNGCSDRDPQKVSYTLTAEEVKVIRSIGRQMAKSDAPYNQRVAKAIASI